MKRQLLLSVLVVAACAPEIPNTPPSSTVVALFDPSLSPPLVPTPNDLATGANGFLAVSAPPAATDADKVFYGWLNTLTGFPASVTSSTTFDGSLRSSTVTASGVKVLDLTAGAAVTGVTLKYVDGAPSTVTVVPPATGWVPGHRYAVAIVGGTAGVQGADGQAVVASPTWALLRADAPIITCPGNDFSQPSACRLGTELIPSDVKSTGSDGTNTSGDRLASQLATAAKLEPLRLKYKPAVDAFVSAGVARSDLALMWTFKVDPSVLFAFDPAAASPVVPSPNDLAIVGGKVHAPVNPAWSDAYKEFTTDYLNTLNGFPAASTATASFGNGDLDPASVSASTVKVLTLRGAPLTGAPTLSYSSTTHTLSVAPPGGSWGKAHTFAIAVIGGANGVKALDGSHVVATAPMALATSAVSLVDCQTLGPSCKSVVPAAPITDQQALGLEQLRRGYKPVVDLLAAAGVARQDLVGLWVFSTVDQPELTFDLASATPVIPFPSNQFLRELDNASPFLPDGGAQHLVFPPSTDPVKGPLFAGLNTLNGFSTTSAIVSENSDTLSALDQDSIDATSLPTATGFAKLASALPNGGNLADGGWPLSVVTCLNCASSHLADGGVQAIQQLQWVPATPLQELTRYAAWATTDMKDSKGRTVMAAPTFALVRLKATLLDADHHSTLPVLADAQAQALEPYRLRFKDCLDQIEARGVPRKSIALGFCLTTQATTSVVRQLAAGVQALSPAVVPDVPTMLVDMTAAVRAQLTTGGVPNADIGHVYFGNLVLPNGLNFQCDTSGSQCLNPDKTKWSAKKAPFILTLPLSAPLSSTGYPIVVFGHGLTRNRTDMLAIANAFAHEGMATIAIDAVLHGERSTCIGAGTFFPQADGSPGSDDAACANPLTQRCDGLSGRCVARDPQGGITDAGLCDPSRDGDLKCWGADLAASNPGGPGTPNYAGQCRFLPSDPRRGMCEGGDFLRQAGTVVVANWNFLNLKNFFATRDNFRYTGAVDFTALARMLAAGSPEVTYPTINAQLQAMLTSATPILDPSIIHFAGQSLGTFNGTAFAAANPADIARDGGAVIGNVALNVPGSDPVSVLLTAPSFASARVALLASLHQAGLEPGTPGFDSFIGLAKTIMDPADPQNLVFDAVNASNSNRHLYFQYIEGDQTLPNSTTLELIGAAQRNASRQGQVFEFTVSTSGADGTIPDTFPAASRHGFLLTPASNPNCNSANASCATVAAQTKLVKFLRTGIAP